MIYYFMRTVSTKLKTDEHERLLELCNQEGQSVSEFLRDLIKDVCDSCEKPKPQVNFDSKPVAKGKIVAINDIPVAELKNVIVEN